MSLDLNQKKQLLESLEYIDDAMLSDTLSRVKTDATPTKRSRKTVIRSVKLIIAIAACAMILALAVPTTTTIIQNSDIFDPVGANVPTGTIGESGQIKKPPEYDGSRGLLYEINEDGESASFVGYGSCTDGTVYIASTYDGLPVTVMYRGNKSNPGNVRHLVISDTVRYVDKNLISMCPNIESVYYGASVENIASFSFLAGYGLNFSKVEVSPDNPHYSDEGNCIVDLRTKALVLGTYNTVIPDDGSVEIIGMRAFSPAGNRLSSIKIPEGVKIIDRYAFTGCDKLESVILPDSLEVIEYHAFGNCKAIKKLELGGALKAIDPFIFIGEPATEVYYGGTVGQWEAIVKINLTDHKILSDIIGNGAQYSFTPFTVYCTDGVSDSEAGKTGKYNWRDFPEYKKYDIGATAIFGSYFISPEGNVTRINLRKTDGQ